MGWSTTVGDGSGDRRRIGGGGDGDQAWAPAFNHPDPPQIVVDEAIGMLIAVCGVPPSRSAACVVAFALFRLLDIAKPWPICRLERWPSPWGVLADDVAAGAVVNLLLRWWAG